MTGQRRQDSFEFDVFQYYGHENNGNNNSNAWPQPYGQPGFYHAQSPPVTPSMTEEYQQHQQHPARAPARPSHQAQGSIEYNPTGWAPTRPQRYSGQSSFTTETPWQSRPASPGHSPGQGRGTPPEGIDGLQPPKNVFDSWPSTPNSPMVCLNPCPVLVSRSATNKWPSPADTAPTASEPSQPRGTPARVARLLVGQDAGQP